MLKLMGPESSIPGLCYSKPSIAVLTRMNSILPKNETEWESWVYCIRYNGLIPLVLNTCLRHQIEIPEYLKKEMQERVREQRLEARQQQMPLVALLKELADHKIPFLVLGLPAYSEELLGDTEALAYPSIKLLFRPQDLYLLPPIYEKIGLICPAIPKAKSWLRRASPSHWPSYLTPDESLVIDTYWVTDDSDPFSHVADWGYWRRAETFFFHDIPCLRLSKEDFIHYICLEISPYGASLVEILTLLNGIQKWPDFNWNRLAELMSQSKTATHVFRALSYAQCIYLDSRVQEFLRPLAPEMEKPLRRLLYILSENPQRLLWARPIFREKLSRLTNRYFLASHLSQKWTLLGEMLKIVFFPTPQQISQLTFSQSASSLGGLFFGRLAHIGFVSKALLYEKGWKQFLLDLYLIYWDFLRTGFSPRRDLSSMTNPSRFR